jgi:hypothetical protein
LAAADHIRRELEDSSIRRCDHHRLMPLALEMVFMADRVELEASMFRQLIRGTWREARDVAA